MRAVNRRARTKEAQRPIKHLLSGIIKCGSCGGNYIGRRYSQWTPNSQTEQYRYVCASFIGRGTSACAFVTLYRDWVEGHVIDIIRERICTPERMDELRRLIHKKIENRRQIYGRDQKAVEQRIRATEKKIANFYHAIGEGMDPAICKEHVARLEAEKAQLERESLTLREEDYYQRALENNLKMLEKFAGLFNERFMDLPFAVKRHAIEHFIESITVVDRSMVRIVVRVPFDDHGITLLADETENPSKAGQPPKASEIFKKTSRKHFVQSDTLPGRKAINQKWLVAHFPGKKGGWVAGLPVLDSRWSGVAQYPGLQQRLASLRGIAKPEEVLPCPTPWPSTPTPT